MALQKQSFPVNFSQGLDLKTDSKQVQLGKFLALSNTIFDKGGELIKRNGFGSLPSLPDSSSLFVTTFNDNLTAVGTAFNAFSQSNSTWVNKGAIQAADVKTLPLIRSNTNQSQADTALSPNGLVCTVYTDNIPVSGTLTPMYRYAVANSVTGQNIVAPTDITPSSGSVAGAPRVFLLGTHFVIVITVNISGTYHLQYVAISTTVPTQVSAAANISSIYTPASTVNFDGYVSNNNLYIAWNGSDAAIHMTYIDSTLQQHNTVAFSSHQATIISVTADESGTTAVIWASFYDSGTSTGYTLAVNQVMNVILAPTEIISSGSITNITSSATNGINSIIYEVLDHYGYDSGIQTDYIQYLTCTQAGVLSSVSTVSRSVGLASKAFIVNSKMYFLTIYSSAYQPTYFLMDILGDVIAKIAYSNGGSYLITGLPSATVSGTAINIPYLIKDLISSVNKTQGAANAAGVYSQTGINLSTIDLGSNFITAEIGNNLNLTGGILWMYDGYGPVEQGFNVWPDYVEADASHSGGSMITQDYFYQATYEWSDNQGNVFRSAPSIPVQVPASDLTGSSNSVTINVPTLRLTYKTANPVKIVIYRWSTAQQTYYQITSLTNPLLNDETVDYVSFLDKQTDAQIVGNSIIYTTGGVLENIAAPASSTMTLFQSRLWLVDAEDRNLLWFSKQVIEATPVEMSDLLTIYVAPTTSAHGSTGPISALSAMDDKLIVFKKNAIYYINGAGPDNTGANSQFSEPTFITATVGSHNQASIVFMPQGLMFQSDKGIWLLGRDLSTTYIGAPVQDLTIDAIVVSAVNVPGTNQVRFTLDSGTTLMYDYYYGQWGSFANVKAISSTLYEDLHTYIDAQGAVFQETPSKYLDGSRPVLQSFTTSWINLAGLQGYERAYYFYLLGTYISPHKLVLEIAYDYNESPTQSTTISPGNYTGVYGSDTLYGGSAMYGGKSTIEQHRVFLTRQKCQAFQITLKEVYDPSKGAPAGAGLTLSGLNLIVGAKSGYPRLKPSNSVG